jgi:formylmethanofuran dehydrogenase subunit A
VRRHLEYQLFAGFSVTLLKIANATVYDPANGVDGLVQDVWLQDGKIVAPPTEPDMQSDKVLDATGYPADMSYLDHGGVAVACQPSV